MLHYEIAEGAFVAAGFLHAETDVDKSKLRWRLWDTPDEEEEFHPEDRGVENIATSGVRPRRRAGSLLFEVKDARRGLKDCQRKLDDSRWAPVSNAGSLNSTGQGEARFRRMKRLTQAVRDAELDHRSVLRRAQNARATSEIGESSNFQDHESDGYRSAELKLYGYPMPAKKKYRIHKWIDNMSQSGEGRQLRARRQGSDSNTEGSWVNRVDSLVFGEDPELKPWCWGNISKPLFRWTDPQNAASGKEAQKYPENSAGGTEGRPVANGSSNDQRDPNSGSGKTLLSLR